MEMKQGINDLCDAIKTIDHLQFLSMFRSIYLQESINIGELDKSLVQLSSQLGLINISNDEVSLTDLGYLLGNISKEFCNWIDSDRVIPGPVPPEEIYRNKDVLDLGCSYGRWLWEFQKHAKTVIGIEYQPEYIQLGEALAEKEKIAVPRMKEGSAEELDTIVAPKSVDFVFCRLVMNHVYIKSTMGKIYGTLRKGGRAWIQVESYRVAIDNMNSRRLRSKVFSLFGLVNSLLFTILGMQLKITTKGRMHNEHKPAYPSLGAWKRVCGRIGFNQFELISKNPHSYIFLVTKG